MISHLCSRQISGLVTGEGTAEEIRHATECEECSAELEGLRETLSVFRDSVQQWIRQAEGPSAVSALLQTESAVSSRHSFRWVLACTAVVLLAAIPAYKSLQEPPIRPEVEDAFLLEQVNAHLSRSIPAPMEPLVEMLLESSPEEVGGRQ